MSLNRAPCLLAHDTMGEIRFTRTSGGSHCPVTKLSECCWQDLCHMPARVSAYVFSQGNAQDLAKFRSEAENAEKNSGVISCNSGVISRNSGVICRTPGLGTFACFRKRAVKP